MICECRSETIRNAGPSTGFIGLGKMGTPMSKNLLKAGYRHKVFDIVKDRMAELVKLGAEDSSSYQNIAQDADIVISMIIDDASLRVIALGPEGVLQFTKPGAIYIDMSTVSPSASACVAREAEEKDIQYLRAKVSGSVKPATEGAITIFVSGPKDAYEKCSGIFDALGKKKYYVGFGEEALYLKLVHSVMVGIAAAMIGEAFTFGERY